ncbi:MAG: DAK2 domain-containing protein [Acidimicrobiales bacterium]
MPTLERLGPRDLRSVLVGYRDALRAHQEAINRLNVYPVPDGDTGTNMALTLESVVSELGEDGVAMPDACRAMSHGSLMGARGNSGVILSQILRGLAETFRGMEAADGPAMAAALACASQAADSAVMRPVEGTILTVVREAAGAACRVAARADSGADSGGGSGAGSGEVADSGSGPGAGGLAEVLEGAEEAARLALARTPELLPVLAQAGVVDAGGAGFVLLLDVLLQVVTGRPVPEPTELGGSRQADGSPGPRGVAGTHGGGAVGHDGGAVARTSVDEAHDAVGDLRYEVMYFLEAPDEAISAFKEVWAGIGDSIVVVGGDGLWNCHIHTDDIGAAVEAALDCGRPRTIRVTDLGEQVEEERWVREAPLDAGEPTAAEPVPTAVVAVATGEGIRRIFRSLGVQSIVAGGQSMNPSTAEILQAVEAAPAQQVVILPNNKNIIPVAEQVVSLTSKDVRVLRTKGVAEGFAALMEYDPQADVDANAQAMADSAARVLAGEVTRAVRDSACEAGPIAAGDYIGLSADSICAVGGTVEAATTALLDHLVTGDHELVTLIEGEGASAADTRRVSEWLAEHRPGIGVEVHHGGQPLYPYLISVE